MNRSNSDININPKKKVNIFSKIKLRYNLCRLNVENAFTRSYRTDRNHNLNNQYEDYGLSAPEDEEPEDYSESETEYEHNNEIYRSRRNNYNYANQKSKPKAKERRRRSSRTRSFEREASLKEIKASTSAKGDDESNVPNDFETDLDRFDRGSRKHGQNKHNLTRTSTLEFIPQEVENETNNSSKVKQLTRSNTERDTNTGIRSPPKVRYIKYSHDSENTSKIELPQVPVHMSSKHQHPQLMKPEYPYAFPNNSYPESLPETSTIIKRQTYKPKTANTFSSAFGRIPNAISSTLFHPNSTKSKFKAKENSNESKTNLFKFFNPKTYKERIKINKENEVNVGVAMGFILRRDKVIRYKDQLNINRNRGYENPINRQFFRRIPSSSRLNRSEFITSYTTTIPSIPVTNVKPNPLNTNMHGDENNNFSKQDEIKSYLKRTFANSIDNDEDESVNLHLTGISSIFKNASIPQSKPSFQHSGFPQALQSKTKDDAFAISDLEFDSIDKRMDAKAKNYEFNNKFDENRNFVEPRTSRKVEQTYGTSSTMYSYTPTTTFTAQFSHLLPGSPNFYKV